MNRYTLDEIIHMTGIPRNKAVEVCRLLCSEGYLIYDENSGKYSLTTESDKLERIRKVKKDLINDARAVEMYSKIQDIMTLGKPMALSEIGRDTLVDIGIPGLNIIFGSIPQTSKDTSPNGEPAGKSPGLPRGHCILVKGAPGTGKTTLGMQIAVHLESANYRSLFLTFEEDITQLCSDLNIYCKKKEKIGWDESIIKKVTRSITKIQTPSTWQDPETVLQELVSILDKGLPQLIVIDSISRLRDVGGESNARLVLRRLIRTLKIRKITTIFLGEDDERPNAFEDYEVDGVICLRWIGDQLSLSVDKMRGMKSYKGPHSAAMLTVDDVTDTQEHKFISEEHNKGQQRKYYLRAGFNVFPEISVYKDLPKSRILKKYAISTGTDGLDKLLEFKINDKDATGFKRGEAVLIIGSAGAGKTLLGLNYMVAGKEKTEKVGVWISLEGDLGTLESATAGFEKPWKDKYNDLYSRKGTKNKEPKFFKFFNFPPLNLDLNKIIYTLEALRARYGRIDRLVIDSITELERAKSGGQPEVKTFLAGLIQYLRDRGITTIFISRSDTFFRSIDKIEEQVSSLVDLIICIRNFDMHNQINKGIYIQKARGRTHNSKIMRMSIDSEKGIEIEDSGWDVENLLAGDSSNIQGPKVFFKLFYENPSEKEVNESIITDFDDNRYPGTDPKFTLVKKTSIYTEFWSFKGQYSSGHANTRVLSIPDYVINAFRDNDRLAEIDKYVKWEVFQKIESEKTLINRYKKKKDSSKIDDSLDDELVLSNRVIDAVPCYVDYGVMVFNTELIKDMKKDDFAMFLTDIRKDWKSLGKESSEVDSESKIHKYNWSMLRTLIQDINKFQSGTKDEIVPFAFPPLDKKSEFVAFFMELLWSYGGDIFKKGIKTKKGKKIFEEEMKNSIFKEFNSTYKNKETDFKKRFSLYGIKHRVNNDIEGFTKWINALEPPDGTDNGFLNIDGDAFKETIKLMLRLVYRAGVKNPIDGEYRHRAILSRNWYSQIRYLKIEQCDLCSMPDKNEDSSNTRIKKDKCMKKHLSEEYHLLPLPLAKIEFDNKGNKFPYYRSITCLAYWSLVMLKNALSPEIGGNFVESMNAPEYYEWRLKNKAGMPVSYMEIQKRKYRSFDPESYDILDSIFENDNKKFEIIKTYLALGEEEWKGKINELAKNSSDIAFINNDEFYEMVESSNGDPEDEMKRNINHRIFFSRFRQSRTAFYQLEEALHYQLKQLFIEDKRFRDPFLYKGYDDKNNEIDIVENIIELCKEERDKKTDLDEKWGYYLEKIIEELRTHIIFELLTYFYKKHLRGEDK